MIDGLIQRGLQQHQAGRIAEAKTLYEQALALDPRHPDALHLLGLTELQSGAAGRAAELIRKASALQPKNWAYLANLAAALTALGELDEALATFRRAARLNPDEPQFQMSIANCFALRGNVSEAETQLRKITQRFSGYALAWLNLGNAVRDQGRTQEAVDFYRRAIAADSDLFDAHNNLGSALQTLGRLEDAEQAYRRALALEPDQLTGLCNLASALIDRGRFAEAEAVCRNALALAPESATVQMFLAGAIGHQGRLHEALEFHRNAAALEPDNVRALMGLGSALHEVGLSAEGLPLLERAVALAPDSWPAQVSLGTVQLALGHFREGWRGYFRRAGRAKFVTLYPGIKLSSAIPRTLTECQVCLLREQGLGDQLFFLRFASELKARGARISYRSAPKIASLLERVATIDCVILDTAPLPPADYNLMLGDLPYVLANGDLAPDASSGAHTLVPPPLPLAPLATESARMREQLAKLGPPPYLGLTWRGGTAPEEQAGGMSWMLFKQIPLPQLGAALRGVNGTFVALQRNPERGEIDQLAAAIGKPVHDFTAFNEDLEAMLALLALLDDYIGVSNTNMHLRAGAGRTARVLVPCPAEWRWMAEGRQSPWFPGFTTYRQTPHGDWEPALAELTGDLAAND